MDKETLIILKQHKAMIDLVNDKVDLNYKCILELEKMVKILRGK